MIEHLSGIPDNVPAFCTCRSGRSRAAIREIIGGDNIYRPNVAVAPLAADIARLFRRYTHQVHLELAAFQTRLTITSPAASGRFLTLVAPRAQRKACSRGIQ